MMPDTLSLVSTHKACMRAFVVAVAEPEIDTVVSIDCIRMLKTDCSGETRLAPHVPSSLSWKAF